MSRYASVRHRTFATLTLAWAYPIMMVACAQEPMIHQAMVMTPVRSVIAERAAFQPTLSIWGVSRSHKRFVISAFESGAIRYSDRFSSGLVSGERVTAGEVIGYVENEPARLAAAESALEYESAQDEYDRISAGFHAGIIAKSDYSRAEVKLRMTRERARSAEARLSRLEISMPSDGVLLVQDSIAPGSRVAIGAHLCTLMMDGPARIEGWAASADRPLLRKGQRVLVSVPRLEDRVWSGRISEVSPVVDEGGILRLFSDLEESNPMIAPGEGVDIIILLDPRQEVITVPTEALIVGQATTSVNLLEPQANHYLVRQVGVQTGMRANGKVEVVSGIRPGDRVAVEGTSRLKTGSFAIEAPPREKQGEPDNRRAEAGSERTLPQRTMPSDSNP